MILLTLNSNDFEPQDYTTRRTVKAVIVNEEGDTLHLSSNLVGGGVEEGESNEEVLTREALEEVGIKIKVLRSLGQIVGYRDALKRKYIIDGYLCEFIEIVGSPTTTDVAELNMKAVWEKPNEAITRFEKEVDTILRTDPDTFVGDVYQAKLYNRQMSLAFLRQAFDSRT